MQNWGHRRRRLSSERFYYFGEFAMKISMGWLKDYVDFDCSAEQIADILSERGFPLEGVEEIDGDKIIDIEVTSNRGDCLSFIGVAREVASQLGKKLKLPKVNLEEADKPVTEFTNVNIEVPQECHRYTVRVIEGVKIGPSPDWMVKRLEALGLRSVNNVVDATNYAMFETGQPSHAFDYDKLKGNVVKVRKAVKGETLVSIDGTKCELDEQMLINADAEVPIGIAGVMGGLDTEVSDSTTTILLEAAHFDPVTVRTTSRKLGINSDASFRFERHVDTEMIDWASQRIADLIIQVAGGKAAKGIVDQYPRKEEAQTVAMRFSRLKHLLGIEIPNDEVVKIFDSLGLSPEVKSDEMVVITPPTWRHDLYREVDLIEEAARCYGYDKIPTEEKINISVAPVDKHQRLASQVRAYLSGCGYFETVNVTFVDESIAKLFNEVENHLSVTDDSKSPTLLRQNLIGSLLAVLKYNHNVKNTPCSVYELSNTFKPTEGTLPDEKHKVGMVSDGDLQQMRGVIDGLIKMIDKEATVEIKPVQVDWAEAAGEIIVNQKSVGEYGVVSQKIKKHFGFDNAAPCAAEIDFAMLMEIAGKVTKVKPIPKYPAITRDLSIILDESVSWADIVAAVNTKKPGELEGINFVGIYRGKPIANGKKSVTLSLTFRDDDGTMRHETVDGFEKEIVDELVGSLKAELRQA